MNLISRVKNIILSPKEEWEVIRKEDLSLGDLYFRYALILIVAAAVAKFLGLVIFGVSMPHGRLQIPTSLALGKAVFEVLIEVGGLLIMAFVVEFLATRFQGEADLLASHKLVVFSSTPGWLGGLLGIFPLAGILGFLFGLYGIYLLYLGAPVLKKIPREKAALFTVVVIIVALAIFFFLGLLLSPFHPMHLR